MVLGPRSAVCAQAVDFAQAVHKEFPQKMLAYNLSPSFNWDAAGMSDKQIEAFTGELGRAGFVWQFITLAGAPRETLLSPTEAAVLLAL